MAAFIAMASSKWPAAALRSAIVAARIPRHRDSEPRESSGGVVALCRANGRWAR
jgi:hypothetical protein